MWVWRRGRRGLRSGAEIGGRLLLLFDIDMTLITTGGSGMKALREAGADLFGPAFTTEGIEFAGRLDPLIIGDMLRLNGVEDSAQHRGALRAGYRRHLEARLREPGIARALPGVHDLLGLLGGADVTLGLLTGNFEETGTLKLRASGLDPGAFEVRVWGDDAGGLMPRRQDLVPVGVERFERLRQRKAKGVTIIGDTPHDVECAKAHGRRCLAVATGQYAAETLRGADLVVGDLSDARGVAGWLVGGEH
jgi:phosphoglycolate phosphatase